MTLGAGCPRCSASVSDAAVSPGEVDTWTCPSHGPITPLWRPVVPDYDSFADHLERSTATPSLAPWPLPPGWIVTDFGSVAEPGRDCRATLVTCTGGNDLDGVVELTIVAEEPGVGIGARVAGTNHTDPGGEIGDGPPHARLRIDGRDVPLWTVLTAESDVSFDRSVFAGEAHGRWLWVVLRPASAALLLSDVWLLQDLGSLGPELIDLPFGGSPSAW